MNEGTLVLKRVINAPVQKVFEAWITPEILKEWYGPEGTTNEIHEMDAREGGAYRLTMQMPNGDKHPLRGVFKKIDAPKKLIFTWQWENSAGIESMGAETVVTVDFKDLGGKTEMTLMHELPNAQSKDMHEKGWSPSFNKLEKVVA